MLSWNMSLVASLLVMTVSLTDASVNSNYTSTLRLQYRSNPQTRLLLPRRTVIVNEFTDNNIALQTSLRVLTSRYNYQRNRGWYTQDAVEYMKRLIIFLDKQDKAAKTATIGKTATITPSEAAQSAQFLREERKFNVRIDTLGGLKDILTDLGILVTLKKQLIKIGNQIQLNTKQVNIQTEVGALESKLELQASTVLQGITNYARSVMNADRAAGVISKLNNLRSQIKPIKTLVDKLQMSKKSALTDIVKWKEGVQNEFLDDIEARTSKLAELYAQNQFAMESIIGVYSSSGESILSETANQRIIDLTNAHFRRETTIKYLEDGMGLEEKQLAVEMAKGQKLSDRLQTLLNRYREDLVSNAIAHSALNSNAVSAVEAIKKGAIVPSSPWLQKAQQDLKAYTASTFALTAKVKAFNQTEETVKQKFQKYDDLLKKNQKGIEFLKTVLQRSQDAVGALEAIKAGLGSIELKKSFNAFALLFPSLLEGVSGTLQPLFASTSTAAMELQVVLAELEQAAVTEPLRRFLGSFLRQQQADSTSRKVIFKPSTSSQRSQLRKAVGPVDEAPLQIEGIVFNDTINHMT